MAQHKFTAAELFAAQALASHLKKELTEDILPYWSKKICKGEFFEVSKVFSTPSGVLQSMWFFRLFPAVF